jgi:hypothetical protein
MTYVGLLYCLAKGKIDALEVTALPESVIHGPAIWSFGFGQFAKPAGLMPMLPRDDTALTYSAAAD